MIEPLKLLLVDDDPDVREIIGMALGLDEAIEVRAASGGAEALRVLGGDIWVPDCMLLDVRMPEPGGEAVLVAARQLPGLNDLPVILLTANVRPGDIARYRALGADEVIAKPFDPLALAGEVRRIVGR